MAYSTKTILHINGAAKTSGSRLGKQAVRLNFSVMRIAKATGATRQTVYNWFVGNPIAPYYTSRVAELLNILGSAKTAEHAWREVCLKFALKV